MEANSTQAVAVLTGFVAGKMVVVLERVTQ